ncbi:MAG: tRNA preQ1(34) S-adenosylmethionine ribosyltransferase-isomerase QueA, partial [Oscillospiraceae bacterium]|nr:tRNA preQ1(34) S-adenosylmethionine ribosyltransferase-isomerase QueA [Oscillospiraceae bacterium]
MLKSDFYYDLPKELIAQHPIEPRDHSRLLHLDKTTGAVTHYHFYNLPDFLSKGDLLVVNNSKVIPARLIGEKINHQPDTVGAACEVLLLRQQQTDVWECLAKPGKRLKSGAQIKFGNGLLTATILDTIEDGNKIIKFDYDHSGNFYALLDKIGQMPLPHYIEAQLEDNDRYQTVYATERGSAAAPTAGLHFTDSVFASLKEKGVQVAQVTLHVGLGTFRPVKENNITDHIMHSEWYHISQETADMINATKAKGGRVIAVGTTSCRTLESAMQTFGEFKECSGDTSIFIYPGYTFKAIDGLLTNFHLPESTLIMLVSAFAG